MAKNQAEWNNSLSIFWLKKHGYLDRNLSYCSGSIKWTYRLSGSESSIGFAVIRNNWGTAQETACIELRYTYTNQGIDEKESMDYKPLLAVIMVVYDIGLYAP